MGADSSLKGRKVIPALAKRWALTAQVGTFCVYDILIAGDVLRTFACNACDRIVSSSSETDIDGANRQLLRRGKMRRTDILLFFLN